MAGASWEKFRSRPQAPAAAALSLCLAKLLRPAYQAHKSCSQCLQTECSNSGSTLVGYYVLMSEHAITWKMQKPTTVCT